MVFFTTPELMEIGGLPFTSPNEKPTRLEALRYYRRVTDTFNLRIAFDETVRSEPARRSSTATGPFIVDSQSSRGRDEVHARYVVIATGAYDFPNVCGSRAKTCRTSRTTTRNRTRTTGNAW